MSDDGSAGGSDRLEVTDDGWIIWTITGQFSETVTGWAEAREDLGLNPAGPEPVGGVLVVDETEHYHDEGDEYPHGYGPVMLKFSGIDALESARDRLYDKATERFEWGDHNGAEKVQDLAAMFPGSYDVKQAKTNDLKATDNECGDDATDE